MLRLIIFISLSQFLQHTSYGQIVLNKVSNQKDTTQTSIRIYCGAILPQKEILVIINGTKFTHSSLPQNLFNNTEIESINVFLPKKDTLKKQFGNAAKNGIILVKTKKPIKWISSKKFAMKKFFPFFWFHKKTLFVVDGQKNEIGKKLFFVKDYIKNVVIVTQKKEAYLDKPFKRILYISHNFINKN